MNIFDPGDETARDVSDELDDEKRVLDDDAPSMPATEIVKAARKAKKKGAKKAAKKPAAAKKAPKKAKKASGKTPAKKASGSGRTAGKVNPASGSKRGPKGRPESQRMRKGDATYGKRVTAARKAKGLTQYALAEKMGVGQPSICNVEKGTLGAGVAMQKLFKKHLGVPLSKACEAAIERGSVNQVKVRGTSSARGKA